MLVYRLLTCQCANVMNRMTVHESNIASYDGRAELLTKTELSWRTDFT